MEVRPVGQEVAAGQSRIATSAGAITQDAFLQLLIVQLQNQDPLNPLDNQEFIAQLATFNSLDQLIRINEKLDSIQAEQLRLGQLEATFLIGKEIRARGNRVSLQEGQQAELHYDLATDATRVVVNIMDSEGSLVRTLEVGSQSGGKQTVRWDGKDNKGKPLSAGIYTFEVNAFDVNGNKVEVTTFIQGVVTGVSLTGTEPLLAIGDLEVPVSAVSGVQEHV